LLHQILIQSRYAWIVGDRMDAVALLRDYTGLCPDDKQSFLTLGQYLDALNKPAEAVDAYKAAIDNDSLFASAWNQMAYSYQRLGKLDEAIVAVDRYIAIAPDQPNPYDSKAEVLMLAGLVEEAVKAFNEALTRDSSYVHSALSLAILHLHQGDYDLADSQIVKLTAIDSSIPGNFSQYFRATGLVYRARLSDALQVLEEKKDGERLYDRTIMGWYSAPVLRARILWAQGRLEEALSAYEPFAKAERWDMCPEPMGFLCQYLMLLIEAGRKNDAQLTAAHWEAKFMDMGTSDEFDLLVDGVIAFIEGNDWEAVNKFSRAGDLSIGWFSRYMLGRSLLNAGDFKNAIEVFEMLQTDYIRRSYQWPVWDSRTKYYLAIAYESDARAEDAIRAYQEYLRPLGDADSGIAEIDDARSRLARLIKRS